ncbi:MAG: GNAT family N-acetyltransferase [Pseudomonadota bacterium]
MRIEPARTADVPALCDLLHLLFTQEPDFSPDRAAQARGLHRILERPEAGCILVARQGGAVVGMVNLLYTESTALGARVAMLEDVVVAQDRQGRGIGSRLLQGAIATARAEDCRRITLLTASDNVAAHRFYRRHGFAGSAMLPMRLLLPG